MNDCHISHQLFGTFDESDAKIARFELSIVNRHVALQAGRYNHQSAIVEQEPIAFARTRS